MCPRNLSTIRSQPLTMFRFPKPGLPTHSNPHTSSLGFHHIHEIPSAKISTLEKSTSPNFSQNNFAKNFPGTFPKIFPANATIARFAIFPKCRIAPFVRVLHPIQTSCNRPWKIETVPVSDKENCANFVEFLQEKFLKFILATYSQWRMLSGITQPLQNFSLTRSRNSKTPGRHSPDDLRRSPHQNHPILQCRSWLPVEPVTGS